MHSSNTTAAWQALAALRAARPRPSFFTCLPAVLHARSNRGLDACDARSESCRSQLQSHVLLHAPSLPMISARALHAVPAACARQPPRFTTRSAQQTSSAATSPSASKSKAATKEENPFEQIGLNRRLASLLSTSYPAIQAPTPAQAALIPALLDKPKCDLVVRAQTGTGKSFGILLALLAQPRLRFQDPKFDVFSMDAKRRAKEGEQEGSTTQSAPAEEHLATASIVIVPTNELANQYRSWARKLIPNSALESLDPILQVVTKGSGLDPEVAAAEPADQLARLRKTPPHILVGTASALQDLASYADAQGASARRVLGLKTARTLVLDEADALFKLPGRFPNERSAWKHEKHLPPALLFMNRVARARFTCSSGDPVASAGLEYSMRYAGARSRSGARPETRPEEPQRRKAHVGRERAAEKRLYAPMRARPEKPLDSRDAPPPPDLQPLQLVCVSATANSVLRHFLGARTGWLRIGHTEKGKVRARWLDLLGLSGELKRGYREGAVLNGAGVGFGSSPREEQSRPSEMLPKELRHYALVLDEPSPFDEPSLIPSMRNFKSLPTTDFADADEELLNVPQAPRAQEGKPDAVSSWGHEPEEAKPLEDAMVRAAAYAFAVEGAQRALAIIPPQWSILRTVARLQELGVPAQQVRGGEQLESAEADGPVMHVLQSVNARGIDLPQISHVFILGWQAAHDPVQYTHLAGRAARMQAAEQVHEQAQEQEQELESDDPFAAAFSGLQRSDAQRGPNFARPPGAVITIVGGLRFKDQTAAFQDVRQPRLVSRDELAMKSIYKLLGVRRSNFPPDFFQLAAEDVGGEEQEPQQQEEQERERAAAAA